MAVPLLISTHRKPAILWNCQQEQRLSYSCGNDNRHKCKRCRNGCNKHSWNNNHCDHSTRWSNNQYGFDMLFHNPTTFCAPTPTKAPADVISVYSDAYTKHRYQLNPDWGQQTNCTEIQIDGNNTLEYANLNYQGLDYPATDVSAMEYVHLDY